MYEERSIRLVLRALGLAALVGAIAACGDDEPSAEESCNAACHSAVGACPQVPVVEADCSAACQVGYSLVPACGGPYQAVLECAGGRPFVQCTENSVTVSTAVTECADELGNYLGCVAGALVPACLPVPLGDAECGAQGLPPRAYACVGEPQGCQLFEGTMRAGGVGTFCCP